MHTAATTASQHHQRLSERMSCSATDRQLSGAAQINDARGRAPKKERPPSAERRAKSFGGGSAYKEDDI
jgi:hypothetical protein